MFTKWLIEKVFSFDFLKFLLFIITFGWLGSNAIEKASGYDEVSINKNGINLKR